MTDFKQKDMIRLLESQGWELKRNSKHKVYRKNKSTISVPHGKIIKRNTVRDIMKLVDKEAS